MACHSCYDLDVLISKCEICEYDKFIPMTNIMKTKTLDEVCGQPKGSFKLFIEKQRQELQGIERERKSRIIANRKK